jgi:cytochrome P450
MSPSTALPPGPDQGPLAQAVTFHRDPLGTLRKLQDRYGDVITVAFPTVRPMVVVADPDLARGIALADPERAHAGDGRRKILPFASPRSSFGGDEGQHQTARGRLGPAFAPERIDAQRDVLSSLTEGHVASWPRRRPFRLLPRVRLLLDEVAAHVLLGIQDPQRARAYAVAFRRMLWTPGNPPLSLPGPHDGVSGALLSRLADRRMEPVRQILRDELRERRRGAAASDGEDALACLMAAGLSDDEAIDELFPVLMAAQEPPSAALTWMLEQLARHPDVAQRYLESPAESAYREAVVKEVLRIRPPALAMLRRLTEPLRVDGHVLPAGITVVAPIVLLHRHPGAFPEPDELRPERWLVPDGPHALHAPFGVGGRRCLGEPLAHAEIGTILPEILRRLKLTPAWPRPEKMVLRATTLVPHRSGLVVARDR